MEEYNGANFNHPGKKLHKKKQHKKEINHSDYANQVDAFSVTESNKMLKGEKEMVSRINSIRSTNLNETEDTLIKIIDLKNLVKKE